MGQQMEARSQETEKLVRNALKDIEIVIKRNLLVEFYLSYC